jgi:hypothetical protein
MRPGFARLIVFFLKFTLAYLSVCLCFVGLLRLVGIEGSTFGFAAWMIVGVLVCDFTRTMLPKPNLSIASFWDAYKAIWWFSWWPRYLLNHVRR